MEIPLGFISVTMQCRISLQWREEASGNSKGRSFVDVQYNRIAAPDLIRGPGAARRGPFDFARGRRAGRLWSPDFRFAPSGVALRGIYGNGYRSGSGLRTHSHKYRSQRFLHSLRSDRNLGKGYGRKHTPTYACRSPCGRSGPCGLRRGRRRTGEFGRPPTAWAGWCPRSGRRRRGPAWPGRRRAAACSARPP